MNNNLFVGCKQHKNQMFLNLIVVQLNNYNNYFLHHVKNNNNLKIKFLKKKVMKKLKKKFIYQMVEKNQ